MKTCPSESELNDLVLGTLSGSVAEALTEHVGECETCQTAMQKLAEGEVPVDSLAAESMTAAPPQNSAYWDVRQSISNLHPNDFKNAKPASTREFALNSTVGPMRPDVGSLSDPTKLTERELSFLETCDDPAYIGCLQHFQVSRVIGRGGMGVVLEAFDPHLHRQVAIKVLGEKFQNDKTSIERFCREGRAAAAISHEHVVQMYQVSRIEEGELAFLVMQLIEGPTLDGVLKEKSPLAPEEVARIGMQIAAGLSAAHENGMVHRDIKPGNILIEDSTQRVKLTDFGLARINDDVKLTRTGMLLGTVLYMSPEQSLGQTVDERSDLFSLGAVMYEMATGISAFDAPTPVGVMKRIMDEAPPAPHKINPEIGKPISDLIMQMLEKKPAARPDNAGLVARALASVVTEHGPISPLQVPSVPSSEIRKLSNQKTVTSKAVSVGGWLLASLLLIGLALSTLLGWESWGPRKPDGLSVIVETNGTDKDVSEMFSSVLLGNNPGVVWGIDFSNDGNTLAAGIGDGSVRFWDIEKQEVIKSFDAHRGNVWNIEFHPTLNLVATVGDDKWVKLWDATTFELKHGWKAENTVRGLAFSPTQKTLAAGDRAGKLHIYDIETGEQVKTVEQDGTILGVAYSSDGKSITTVGSDKIVRVFDTTTYEQRQTFTGHAGPIYSVAYSTDGPLIASVGFESDTWVWNSDTGEKVIKLEGYEGDNWGVAFLGQGRQLITGGQDGTARVWDLESGENIATFSGHTQPVLDIALDQQGSRIATSGRGGDIRVWNTKALDKVIE